MSGVNFVDHGIEEECIPMDTFLIALATITFIHGYKHNFVHTLDRWVCYQLKNATTLAFVRSRA